MRVIIQFENKPLLFESPRGVISSSHPGSLARCFAEMENAVNSGYYLAGFLSYEAGYFFQQQLREDKNYAFPLLCFGVYERPPSLCRLASSRTRAGKKIISDPRFNISKEKYSGDILSIKSSISKGDVYQITYCLKLLFDLRVDPFILFSILFGKQPVPYSAYLENNEFSILSLSPELFIKKTSTRLVMNPMKGTWPRGGDPVSDYIGARSFRADPKNRAENVMIADLIRNDLGRIGSDIRVERLFEVSKYKTLFQMTSMVSGRVKESISFLDLLSALFPSGSVTGAPKIKAMKFIRCLEREERAIYTGALGYITPRREFFFNVPIRTLLVRAKSAEMGIGGGIVWDSTPEGEWDECVLKSKFITDI